MNSRSNRREKLLRIASWNVDNGLARLPVATSPIVGSIKDINDHSAQPADIVFLSESFGIVADMHGIVQGKVGGLRSPAGLEGVQSSEAAHIMKESTRKLGHNLGYEFTAQTSYDDQKPRIVYDSHDEPYTYQQFMTAFSRHTQPIIRRLATRNAIRVEVPTFSDEEESLQVWGVHNDDRSEARRRLMMRALGTYRSSRTVLIGDLNAMDASRLTAKILASRSIQIVGNHMPHPRLRSIMTRLSSMAGSEVLPMLKEAGLTQVDAGTRTMKLGPVALLQLDYAFLTQETLRLVDHQTFDLDGSDHKAISITVASQ